MGGGNCKFNSDCKGKLVCGSKNCKDFNKAAHEKYNCCIEMKKKRKKTKSKKIKSKKRKRKKTKSKKMKRKKRKSKETKRKKRKSKERKNKKTKSKERINKKRKRKEKKRKEKKRKKKKIKRRKSKLMHQLFCPYSAYLGTSPHYIIFAYSFTN